MDVEQVKENRRKWVAALRSGEFQQTTGRLRRRDASMAGPAGYCCLGVACQVLDPDGWGKSFYSPTGDSDADSHRFGSAYSCSSSVKGFDPAHSRQGGREVLGLNFDSQEALVVMNDMGHKTFAEIADFIETLPIVSE